LQNVNKQLTSKHKQTADSNANDKATIVLQTDCWMNYSSSSQRVKKNLLRLLLPNRIKMKQKKKSFLSLNWLLEERKKRIWRNRCCLHTKAICLHHHRHLLLHQREEESTHHLSLHCLIILWNFPFGLIWLISIRTCIFLSHHHYFHVVSFSHKKTTHPPTNSFLKTAQCRTTSYTGRKGFADFFFVNWFGSCW